jgi:nicotinamidase-related amidase
VLTGIATNLGVESTARQAFEHGYTTILVADATSALSAEEHDHPLRTVFPRIARVATTAAVLEAIGTTARGL